MSRDRRDGGSRRWMSCMARYVTAAIVPVCALAAWTMNAQTERFAQAAAHLQPVRLSNAAANRMALRNGPLMKWRPHDDIDANWAGYVLPGGVLGGNYTSAQGTWIVPKVSWVNYPNDPRGRTIIEDSSTWIGIGGLGETVLIQLGTDQAVVHDNTTQKDITSYTIWYELYPAPPVSIDATRFAVQPGDTITATLQCMGACKPGGATTWNMSMMDQNRWKTPFTIQVQNPHTILATAEWIVEDNGAYCGANCALVLASSSYLPDYQKITFTGITANGANPGLSRAQQAMMVVDPEGKSWSAVSDPVGGNSFTVSFVPPLFP
jgi:hypothetical protein